MKSASQAPYMYHNAFGQDSVSAFKMIILYSDLFYGVNRLSVGPYLTDLACREPVKFS